jgi:hypothetical protein
MNLTDTLKTNNQIMALIESKHPEPAYSWPRNTETLYYERLVLDTHKARQAIKAGGLAPIIDDQG